MQYQTVNPGTKQADLKLPAALKASGYKADATSGEAESITIKDVVWESDEPWDETATLGSFIFTPVLPSGYRLSSEGEGLPEIYVRIGEANNTLGLAGGVLTVQLDSNNGTNIDNNDMKAAIEAALAGDSGDAVTVIKIQGSVAEITEWNWYYLMRMYHNTHGLQNVKELDLSELENLSVIGSESAGAPSGHKLEIVHFPQNITKIGQHAFSDCQKLNISELPQLLCEIGVDAFYNCSALTLKELPANVTKIGSFAFQGCSSLALKELPANVSEIGNFTFQGCSSLALKELPANVTKIGDYAFELCTNLSQIIMKPTTAPTIYAATFNKTNSELKFYVPKGGIGYDSDNWSALTRIEYTPTISITLTPQELELPLAQTAQLTASVTPADAIPMMSWESSNTSVATIDQNGVVTAHTLGTAIITVTSGDGEKTATCTVKVVIPVTGVTLQSALTLEVNSTHTFQAAIIPANATKKEVTWTSSNPQIASVDTDGKVTAHAVGTAIITATTTDGAKTATCTITVEAIPASSGGSSSGGGGSSSGEGSHVDLNVLRGTWIQTETGIWMFSQTSGDYAKNRWGLIDGLWYFFDAEGKMLTGWQFINNQWYYLCTQETAKERSGMKEGAMASGWYFDRTCGKWFYLDPDGAMVTGWREIDGTRYYFNPVSDGTKGTLVENPEV